MGWKFTLKLAFDTLKIDLGLRVGRRLKRRGCKERLVPADAFYTLCVRLGKICNMEVSSPSSTV